MAVMSRRGRGFAGCSPCTESEIPLLQELAAQYPEVSGAAVAHALDRATVAAAALGAGEATPAGIAALARDRLDVLRERTLAAARRAGLPRPQRGEASSAEVGAKGSTGPGPGPGLARLVDCRRGSAPG